MCCDRCPTPGKGVGHLLRAKKQSGEWYMVFCGSIREKTPASKGDVTQNASYRSNFLFASKTFATIDLRIVVSGLSDYCFYQTFRK